MKKNDSNTTKIYISCSKEIKDEYTELYEELGCTHSQLIEYLLRLNAPKFDKGMMMVERSINLMLVSKKLSKINTRVIIDYINMRFGKKPNFNTVLQVIQAYREEIEEYNGEKFKDEYFDKVRAKK